MATEINRDRVNIYLDDPEMKREIKIAAAKRSISQSAYCVEAIRQQLDQDRTEVTEERAGQRMQDAAEALDRLRREIGRVGIPVRELIDEGRRG